MAKKKAEPIITYTEILAIAGRHIQAEILKLRSTAKEVESKADTPERRELIANYTKMMKEQEVHHIKRLEAVETMYQIETGTELGLSCEL